MTGREFEISYNSTVPGTDPEILCTGRNFEDCPMLSAEEIITRVLFNKSNDPERQKILSSTLQDALNFEIQKDSKGRVTAVVCPIQERCKTKLCINYSSASKT